MPTSKLCALISTLPLSFVVFTCVSVIDKRSALFVIAPKDAAAESTVASNVKVELPPPEIVFIVQLRPLPAVGVESLFESPPEILEET